MIPGAAVLVVLALAAYRLTRLLGWDDFPPVYRLRAWATGERSHVSGSSNQVAGLTGEPPQATWSWRRPLLHHLLGCAFCLGFWISCAVYVAWLLEPTGALYALVPFAISGAVGLLAKNLDP